MHAPGRMGIVVCGVTSKYACRLLSVWVEWSQLSMCTMSKFICSKLEGESKGTHMQ